MSNTRARRQRGVVFITAIVAMTVMIITGTIFMTMATQQMRTAIKDRNSLMAIAMADAGVQFTVWAQKYKDESGSYFQNPDSYGAIAFCPFDYWVKTLPYAWSLTFSDNGNILPAKSYTSSVSAHKVQFRLYHAPLFSPTKYYQVISEARVNNYTHRVRTILRAPAEAVTIVTPSEYPWPDYAIFGRDMIELGGQTAVYNGDIGSNGNATLKAGSYVEGDVDYGGELSVKGKGAIGGTPILLTHPVESPAYDYDNLKSLAESGRGRVFPAGWTPPSVFQFLQPNEIIVVEGDANLNDVKFKGSGMVVAKGDIHVSSHVESDPEDDWSQVYTGSGYDEVPLALISFQKMHISGHVDIDGLLYAADPDVPFDFKGASHLDLYGALIGTKVKITAQCSITYARGGLTFPDPGDDGSGDDANWDWTVASWEMLN